MKLEENLLLLLREKACCEVACEVRSRVMVEYDGVALIDASPATGRKNGWPVSWLDGLTVVAVGRPNLRSWRLEAVEGKPSEVEEPDMSMDAAAEVVDAMAVAEAERWWLCAPS